jgi:hypothetical protein
MATGQETMWMALAFLPLFIPKFPYWAGSSL